MSPQFEGLAESEAGVALAALTPARRPVSGRLVIIALEGAAPAGL